MAWTTPRTWTTSELVNASMMNGIRDDLNELWKGTAAGDIQYYSAANLQTNLPIGGENFVLAVESGLPAWVGGRYVILRASASQAIATGSPTNISTFDLEDYDSIGWHSGTDNYVTTPDIGVYLIWGSGYFAGHATASTLRQMNLYIAGALAAGQSTVQASGTVVMPMVISQLSVLNAGVTIGLNVTQNSGGNLAFHTASLSVARIR